MLIEIEGDVWLLSEIIAIGLDVPSDGEKWNVSLRLRGQPDWEIYEMDNGHQAKEKHLELVRAWKAFLERWQFPK